MQTIDLIPWALRMTDESTARLVGDMRDQPRTRPTSRGGNHALWVPGHLAAIKGMFDEVFRSGNVTYEVRKWVPVAAAGPRPAARRRTRRSLGDLRPPVGPSWTSPAGFSRVPY